MSGTERDLLIGFLQAVMIRASQAEDYLKMTEHDYEQRIEWLRGTLRRLRGEAKALFDEVTQS